jgi:hypothetical protein
MPSHDPADMSIDDRLDELAGLLAAGSLRFNRRTAAFRRPLPRAREVRKPRQIGLAIPSKTRPCVNHVNGRESAMDMEMTWARR